MGAGDFLCVEPGVVVAGRPGGQLVVLVVVLAHENRGAAGGRESERLGGLVVVLALRLFLQVAAGHELVVDLGDFSEAAGGAERGLDAREVVDICLAGRALLAEQALGTLELVVFFVAGLHVLHERPCRRGPDTGSDRS